MLKSALKRSVFGLFLTAMPLAGASAGELGYYQDPAAHGDTLIFASEGDLWKAQRDGGTATRLTTHSEEESAPAISRDGKWVAFNANYDGPREVYVMPIEGGAPKQVTFEGGGTAVRGWTRDGKIVYTSSNTPGTAPRLIRLVDPKSLKTETLPLANANLAAFSGDGKTLFFTRHGMALNSDNALLYRGGAMAQLWRYTLGSDDEAVRLAADFGAPIRDPMWWGKRIYFISDKSGSDNIWSVSENGGDITQHTKFTDWQMRAPSLGDGEILFQRGADLHRFVIGTGEVKKSEIDLISDRDFTRTRWLSGPLGYLDDTGMGAEGKSVALTARGNVVVAFPGARRRVELDIPGDARARAAVVGAKGEWVYLVLDRDVMGEIWRYPADGRGKPEQLTKNSKAYIWGLVPSPDGTKIVYADKASKLWSLDIKSRKATLIEGNETGDDSPFSGVTWSKGSRYLAYRTGDMRGMSRVALYDFKTGRREVVTSGKYDAFAPAFSTDGKWLYFVSNRNFDANPTSPWGDRNMGPGFDKRGMIFALSLDPEAEFPFAPKNELTDAPKEEPKSDEKADKKSGKDEKKEDDGEADIVFDGLADRLWQVPVAPGNYGALAANDGFLYVTDRDGGPALLKSVKIDAQSPDVKTFAAGINDFTLSADGKTLFVVMGGGSSLALVPAGAEMPGDLSKASLRVGDWTLAVNPQAEWRQMLLDAWRMHRSFAYDPNMRGVDWDAVRKKYLPLVSRVGHRAELNDLIGQMSAEIGILHSQIGSGDQPSDDEGGATVSLGAEYKSVRKGLEIAKIYQGERDRPDVLGPLLKPGVDVKTGDVITAIDGRKIQSLKDLALALQHKEGQQVRLDLERGGKAHSAIVEPVGGRAARALRYGHWVETRREAVKSASDGKIGYLHLRAMGGGDIASFVRDFYEHYDKDAIIIDVRGNRGGSIDSWIIGTLLRQVWAFWESPNGGAPFTNMQQTFRGHLAVLMDQDTYSDGETFSAGVKALDLAPLIGTRTAGAGIWLSDRNRLADGGIARVAEYPQYGLDGRWLIEGNGVTPDQEVDNPPLATFKGGDAQLDAAIAYLEGKMTSAPVAPLTAKPLPPLGEYGQDPQ